MKRGKMIKDYVIAVKNIRNTTKNYITKYDIKALVIGLSGGIDSTLCSALAKPVCDELSIPLVGRSLPIQTNKVDEIKRAKKAGEVFCTEFKETNLENEFYSFMRNTIDIHIKIKSELTEEDKIREGNIKARLRMIKLYDEAQKRKGMVLSTDNYTEYLLGFWTLHGDVGDYGMIQNLWKTEVYGMANYLTELYHSTDRHSEFEVLSACIDAVPTDGLGVSESDLDQIGAKDYKEVDEILQIWLRFQRKNAFKDHPVVLRHERTHWKRRNPCNIGRETIEKIKGDK
jgi:NAD+ synthetase